MDSARIAECRRYRSRGIGLCTLASESDFQALSATGHFRCFPVHQTVMHDNSEMPFSAILCEGIIKLTKPLADGREQIVGLLYPGDFIGRPFDHMSHVSVECTTDTKLFCIPNARLDELLQHRQDLNRKMMSLAYSRLDTTRSWLVCVSRKSARERVATFLQAMRAASAMDGNNEAEFEVPLTRLEIGEFLGLTLETVSRQFSALRRENIIETRGMRHVRILSPSLLRQATDLKL